MQRTQDELLAALIVELDNVTTGAQQVYDRSVAFAEKLTSCLHDLQETIRAIPVSGTEEVS